ncbi:hypothetical protein [Bacillus phage phiAGATE]|uniref:Uncharacterized protein n=1 Tax=Bacillus phage phiAGATE TaxID=1204533 RepID=L0L8K9_9CAUD|nr:anti-sigma factor [Bacillus phage phiAGATE]AGB62774.1 hypothetical protein [Bacillus phage phiAGATE]
MKLTRKDKDTFIMTVETTEGGTKDLELSLEEVLHVCPFNSNYMYKYSPTRKKFYLCKDRGYKNTDVYKHSEGNNDIQYFDSEDLQVEGFFYQDKVSDRNWDVVYAAERLGIPNLLDLGVNPLTQDDIKAGHIKLAEALDALNEKIAKRYLDSLTAEEVLEDRHIPNSGNEDWYATIYTVATREEEDQFILYGEIYNMLRLMRRFIEVK